MAKYGFFYDNKCTSVAESDEEKDFLSSLIIGATVKTLTEEQFNNAKNYKSLLTLNGETVEETFHLYKYLNDATINVEDEKLRIKEFIQGPALTKIKNWLLANPSSNDFSYWNDYKNKLETLDVNSMSLPLAYETFQEWFNNQTGYPQKSPLQLP